MIVPSFGFSWPRNPFFSATSGTFREMKANPFSGSSSSNDTEKQNTYQMSLMKYEENPFRQIKNMVRNFRHGHYKDSMLIRWQYAFFFSFLYSNIHKAFPCPYPYSRYMREVVADLLQHSPLTQIVHIWTSIKWLSCSDFGHIQGRPVRV